MIKNKFSFIMFIAMFCATVWHICAQSDWKYILVYAALTIINLVVALW